MLLPEPQKAQYSNGSYQTKRNYLHYDLYTFYDLIKGGNEDITVIPSPMLGREEYHLTICETGAAIRASCDESIYRAATTLWHFTWQGKGKWPFVNIKDKPALERRGYMLDISRGRKPRMDTLKKLIDYLSSLKYNEFQLYMEGECFKYAAYPEYTEFDCLTPQDIKELDLFCRERFIDLVPNQNSFGHMTSWLKHPAFRHMGLFEGDEAPNTLNPLLDETYAFMDNVYGSLLPYFKSEYVNIGLDEAYGLGRFQIEEYCKAHGKEQVFMDWLNKLNTLAHDKYGKKVMFWSDMIYKSEHLYDQIPKDAVILEWGYELIQSQMMTEHCIAFQKAGLDYYVCPATNIHCSFTGRSDVTTFNIRTAAELGVKFGAKGLLLTDWGNLGHPQFLIWSYMPIALAGQYAWNPGAEQSGEDFKAHYIRSAEKYVDDYFFGGTPVSIHLFRISNYYLLEPERVHVGTMCAELFPYPLSQTNYAHIFDLKDSGDPFCFDLVINYVNSILPAILEKDIDPQLKREIMISCDLVLIASQLCKIKLGQVPSNEKLDQMAAKLEDMAVEYEALWNMRNYENGAERVLKQMRDRRSELLALKS